MILTMFEEGLYSYGIDCHRLSNEVLNNFIYKVATSDIIDSEELYLAKEFCELLDIRRQADAFDVASYDAYLNQIDDERADEEANYPVFARFVIHDFMDMYPSYEVQVMPRKDIYSFVEHMNKYYSGGTTAFDSVLSKKEVENYIDRMIRYYPEEVPYIEYLQDNYYKIFQVLKTIN